MPVFWEGPMSDQRATKTTPHFNTLLPGSSAAPTNFYLNQRQLHHTTSINRSFSTPLLQPLAMKLYDATSNNPMVVRLFALERGGLSFDVEVIDIMNLQNRRLAYRQINPQGTLPALQLNNGKILTEVCAICEYLDEVADGGQSLFGTDAETRAETRMMLRRVDYEIAQPLIAWWRNDPATVDFYQGHRLPIPEARLTQKVEINQALNRLDDFLEGKTWLCGERYSAADIHFYGLMKFMISQAEWVLLPGRRNVCAYFQRMDERPYSSKAMQTFEAHIKT